MRDASIVVVGSLNLDLVIAVPACPRPGETVIGGDLRRFHGGKGANQAVAAARAGGRVAMVGCVGSDDAGTALLDGLARDRIDASQVSRSAGPSGLAVIAVDRDGENSIVVVPGANAELTPAALGDEPRSGAAVALIQLEIPIETVAAAVARAAERRIPVVLNAAPAHPGLPASLLAAVDVLVVNQHEAASLAGASRSAQTSAAAAPELAGALCRRGPRCVVITRGARGLVWHAGNGDVGEMAAFDVTVVDTTAAGDAFCGALAVAIAERAAWRDALRFASAAGALAVTRSGAQPSLALRGDIEHLAASRQP
jgi:ribokinase